MHSFEPKWRTQFVYFLLYWIKKQSIKIYRLITRYFTFSSGTQFSDGPDLHYYNSHLSTYIMAVMSFSHFIPYYICSVVLRLLRNPYWHSAIFPFTISSIVSFIMPDRTLYAVFNNVISILFCPSLLSWIWNIPFPCSIYSAFCFLYLSWEWLFF